MNKKITALLLISPFLLSACALGTAKKSEEIIDLKPAPAGQTQTEEAPPAEAIDQKTGEVDDQAFEEDQKVSSDDSLETLEKETNETVILEEDFSDL